MLLDAVGQPGILCCRYDSRTNDEDEAKAGN